MISLIKKPSAWLPIAMSVAVWILLAVSFATHGLVHEADEGTAAHLFQLLMGAQVPIILFFLIKWLPQAPRETLKIFAIQILAVLVACAPVFYLRL